MSGSDCIVCSGRGEIELTEGWTTQTKDCSFCRGTGLVEGPQSQCYKCLGEGVEKSMFRKETQCSTCHGEQALHYLCVSCPACKGEGKVGFVLNRKTCMLCKGNGRLKESPVPCRHCDATGGSRFVQCGNCAGTGWNVGFECKSCAHADDFENCAVCDGKGFLEFEHIVCGLCRGRGSFTKVVKTGLLSRKKIEKMCKRCQGNGILKKEDDRVLIRQPKKRKHEDVFVPLEEYAQPAKQQKIDE